ncbi:MAG TPA: hypothetical protein VM305_01635 [Candidatus Limnocylindrales bacterium]|nr:hypothetical protein [Candidatus Limnocylindrales bacterium]
MVLGYIDIGSGSLIIQALIAGLAAVPFFFRRQLGRVLAVVRRDEPQTRERVQR